LSRRPGAVCAFVSRSAVCVWVVVVVCFDEGHVMGRSIPGRLGSGPVRSAVVGLGQGRSGQGQQSPHRLLTVCLAILRPLSPSATPFLESFPLATSLSDQGPFSLQRPSAAEFRTGLGSALSEDTGEHKSHI